MVSKNEAKQIDLTIEDFIINDPLARYFIIQKKWTPIQLSFFAYIWAVGWSVLIATKGQTLWTKAGYISLSQDFLYWITESTLIPLLWGYYTWMIKAPLDVLNELATSKVYNPKKEDANKALMVLNKPWITPASIFLSVGLGVLYFIQSKGVQPPYWFAINDFLLGTRTVLVIIPTSFVVFTFIFRSVINIQIFRNTLNDLNIQPLHPDKSGGLRPLGKYALSASYTIALGGIAAGLSEYYAWYHGVFFKAYFYHIGLVIYIFLGPIGFFAPLWSAHKSMLLARNNLLLYISRQFSQDFSNAYNGIKGSSKILKDGIEKIEQTRRLHNIAVSFPVWPFDLDILRRFIFAMATPILPIITAIIVNLLT